VICLVGLRISTRTDLKNNILEVYQSINENKVEDAINSLKSARMNLTIYYNTRGIDCKEFKPIFVEIENLLRKNHLNNPSKNRLCEEKLLDYLFKLNKALRFNIADPKKQGEIMSDPMSMLKNITEDLIDDYSETNMSGGQETYQKNRNVLELLRNDLLEIRDLEAYFKNMPGDIPARFNTVLKAVNQCLGIMPQVKDVSVNVSIAKQFRLYFEALFHTLTDVFVPIRESHKETEHEHPEQKPEIKEAKQQPEKKQDKPEEKKEEKKPIDEPKQEQSTIEIDETTLDDLEEMERKAKEGIIDEK